MKLKIIEKSTESELQKEVNRFFSKHRIVSVQYILKRISAGSIPYYDCYAYINYLTEKEIDDDKLVV